MRSRSLDEALQGVQLQSELSRVRHEVTISEQRASKPSVFLPCVKKDMRLAPNVALRTALFSAMADRNKQDQAREFVRDRQVAGLSNMRVRFTGQVLDQQDLDVFLAVLVMARDQALGSLIVVPARQLLCLQGKGDDGRSYVDLHASLKRLAGAVLEIEQGSARFIGSLISSAKRLHSGDAWTIRVDPDLVNLFMPGGYTSLNAQVRAALNGKPLAKWLDGYYSSQPNAHPLKLETVRDICGSKAKDMRSFKQTLVKALLSVEMARRAHGAVFVWEIDRGGLLKVRI